MNPLSQLVTILVGTGAGALVILYVMRRFDVLDRRRRLSFTLILAGSVLSGAVLLGIVYELSTNPPTIDEAPRDAQGEPAALVTEPPSAGMPVQVGSTRSPEDGQAMPVAVALLSSGHRVDSYGGLELIGEVQNTGSVIIDAPEIIAALYQEDRFLGSDNAYAFADVMQPGERSAFRLYFSSDEMPASWDRYEIVVQAEEASEYEKEDAYLYPHLELQAEVELRGERWTAFGTVTNTGSKPAYLVEVAVSLYDEAGGLVGAFKDYVDLDRLPPNTSSTFTAYTYMEKIIGEVETWRAVVYGRVDDDS